MTVQTVRALLRIGEWLKIGLVTDKDMLKCLRGLKDIEEDNESDVDEGWDDI